MKKLLAAVAAIALTAVLPAQATTFSLRTIYVASGVYDSGDPNDVGTATSVICTNLSGKSATLQVSFYSSSGVFLNLINQPFPNLRTLTVSTHGTFFIDFNASTGFIGQGVLNIQSTESAVFCSAMIVDAAGPVANGIDLHMVRYNPHPGTVE